MQINQYDIWIADLNPQIGIEAGKKRPVLIVQTNLLNKIAHPSTIVCPISTNIQAGVDILRVHLKQGMSNVREDCDIMIDQMRSIDNNRLINKVGVLSANLIQKVKENIAIVMDLD